MKRKINSVLVWFGCLVSVVCNGISIQHTSAETAIPLRNISSERVVDMADIFSPEEESSIKESIFEIEQKTHAQVAILTLKTLQDRTLNPEHLGLFQFGMELLSDAHLGWNVGEKKDDTGLFLCIVVDDHMYRFFTGYGLEGVLPDLYLKTISERYFPVYFRQKQYFAGVQKVLIDIKKVLEHDSEVVRTDTKSSLKALNKGVIFLFFVSFFGGLFVSTIKDKAKKQRYIGTASIGIVATIFTSYIDFEYGIFAFILFLLIANGQDDSSSGGIGSWSSGTGFGGGTHFSGFGGGSFGGGGFGGDW